MAQWLLVRQDLVEAEAAGFHEATVSLEWIRGISGQAQGTVAFWNFVSRSSRHAQAGCTVGVVLMRLTLAELDLERPGDTSNARLRGF